MSNIILYDIETLINLIGLSRSDSRLQAFISQFGSSPVAIVDKEDGADDEYIEFKEWGFCFYLESDTLLSIFLHTADKGSGYSPYNLALPLGISFEQSKYDLIDLIGKPDDEGGGGEHDDFLGDIPEWVIFKMDNIKVHVEFVSNLKSIRMVTLELFQ